MRIAIVSDIHGNRTAFEAVLADLRQTSPDLILHGGDLADAGASPVEIVDRIRDLGWQGVVGNTDEMLFNPESLTEFAKQSPQMQPLLPTIQRMAAATCPPAPVVEVVTVVTVVVVVTVVPDVTVLGGVTAVAGVVEVALTAGRVAVGTMSFEAAEGVPTVVDVVDVVGIVSLP